MQPWLTKLKADNKIKTKVFSYFISFPDIFIAIFVKGKHKTPSV